MKSKHFSPPIKPPIKPKLTNFHNSASTFQASGNLTPTLHHKHNLNNPQSQFHNNQKELQTISSLRKDLQSIKGQMTELMESGIGITSPILEKEKFCLQKNIQKRDKNTNENHQVNKSKYIENGNINYDLQKDYNKIISQLKILKQNYQKLEKQKNTKQSNIQILNKQLIQIKMQKLQLLNIIQNHQNIKKINQQQYQIIIKQNAQLVSNLIQHNKIIHSLSLQNQRLKTVLKQESQQTSIIKIQNNKLMNIIQQKQQQITQFSQKIKQLKSLQQQNIQIKQKLKNKTIDIWGNNLYKNSSIDNLQNQNIKLKQELFEKQNFMIMMLNDIKKMDQELIQSDSKMLQFKQYQQIINQLNQTIIKKTAQVLNHKYKIY